MTAGFVERRVGRIRVVVDPHLDPALEGLGLLVPDAWARFESAAAGSSGRQPTVILEPPTGGRILLRRVLHGGLLGPLLGAALWGLGRPLRELEDTARLRGRGAPVPEPLFVWGERRLGPLYRAAVATRLVEDARDLLAFLQSDPPPARVLAAARAAGAAVRRLHDAGGRHADLHLKNLLLREQGATLECLVVDLDGVRVGEPVAPRRRMQELMRLLRSLHKRGVMERVGPRGLACFFRSYVAGDRELRRALLAHLPRERLRMAVHATRYRRPR